ncbi:GDSL-like Lipase/Acylhydrolase superfamily protein [Striga asiatica]|uniref:GDSL-like Lipase/Acylhydrolase superfamily protein n=1 Tax=Striga asiatica TaxID=4170 RepID=A0A5A7PGX0_STRAF|nr:GDSL-like Lipase/Acylhydrolase superfamily protein [Striga asiatica]
MAPYITKCMILIIVSVFVTPQMQLIQAQQQVPGMYLFGDSQFDNGNNNFLITTSKTNYPPYGIDYPDGPTGRFSNGLTIPDGLALLLGFDRPISPFVAVRGSDINLRGVNYGSGGAGILKDSGILLGDRFTMDEQLQNHQTIIRRITLLLGSNQTAVNEYLNKCLYVVNIGSNDYLNNYYLLVSTSRLLYSPDEFSRILIKKFSQQLRTLYNNGARKVAVFGVGLLGCLPQELANFPPNGTLCVDFINNGVQFFNMKLPPLIDTLNDLPNAEFTLINTTSISLGDPSLAGIQVTNASCCPTVRSTGLCVPNRATCSNRDVYVFWDNFHPTDIVNRATARRAYSQLLRMDAYPVDIRTLLQQ